MNFQELLAHEFAPYGTLSPAQLATLEGHYQLLLRWNQKLNLTRIDSLEEAVRLHYCESLFLATLLPAGPLRIADIGSGAGFPGFPLAVFRPDCSVTLVESHQRKAVFLKEAVRGLPKTKVTACRAEDLPQPPDSFEKPFDWIVCRAVVPQEVLRLRIGHGFALLVGAEAADLGEPVRIPWGKDRFAVIVSRGTVPRET